MLTRHAAIVALAVALAPMAWTSCSKMESTEATESDDAEQERKKKRKKNVGV